MKISSISAAHRSWSCQQPHCGGAALGGGSNLESGEGRGGPVTSRYCSLSPQTHTHIGFYCSAGQKATEAIFSLSSSINLLKACSVVKTSSFHQLQSMCVCACLCVSDHWYLLCAISYFDTLMLVLVMDKCFFDGKKMKPLRIKSSSEICPQNSDEQVGSLKL